MRGLRQQTSQNQAGRGSRQRGQATIETAIGLPLLMMLAFNVINIGYFWFVVMALSAAPRHAVQYASQGGVAGTSSAPDSTAVSDVAYNNVTNAVASASKIAVQVCIASNGTTTAGRGDCDNHQYGGSTYTFSSTPDTDPNSTYFTLQRVSVSYTVSPLIPGGAFNVLVPSTLNFRRGVEMRNLYGVGGGG